MSGEKVAALETKNDGLSENAKEFLKYYINEEYAEKCHPIKKYIDSYLELQKDMLIQQK